MTADAKVTPRTLSAEVSATAGGTLGALGGSASLGVVSESIEGGLRLSSTALHATLCLSVGGEVGIDFAAWSGLQLTACNSVPESLVSASVTASEKLGPLAISQDLVDSHKECVSVTPLRRAFGAWQDSCVEFYLSEDTGRRFHNETIDRIQMLLYALEQHLQNQRP